MKTLFFAAVLVGVAVYKFEAGPFAHAQTVEQASKNLARTEMNLRTAANSTVASANAMKQEQSSPERASSLPKELQEFDLNTKRLTTQRDNLNKDLDDYAAAYQQKLQAFDAENAAIVDEATKRTIAALRRELEQTVQDSLTVGRATLMRLDAVLAKGADLQHAAKCVLIAEELDNHGKEMDAQLKAATDQARSYTTITNTLLARLNTAAASTN